jgi:hypothetical protein
MRDGIVDRLASEDEGADVESCYDSRGYSSKLEAIFCQCELEGSSDGAGEGDAGEGSAAEDSVCSEGMRNLVSWLPSINDVMEGIASAWKGAPMLKTQRPRR